MSDNQEIVVAETMPVPAPVEAATGLLSMIERAARDPSVDLDKLERLLAMHREIEARNAKRAFDTALAEMQIELPVIEKRGRIDIGRGKPQAYALWEDINEKTRPILHKYGFVLQFRSFREQDKIMVTGILSHRDGHREETTMTLPIDTTGSKNGVQAIGSTTSYGKRYTAMALLNITSRGEDDDGMAGGNALDQTISEAQADEIRDLVARSKTDVNTLLEWAGVKSIPDLRVRQYVGAVALLNARMKGKQNAKPE